MHSSSNAMAAYTSQVGKISHIQAIHIMHELIKPAMYILGKILSMHIAIGNTHIIFVLYKSLCKNGPRLGTNSISERQVSGYYHMKICMLIGT